MNIKKLIALLISVMLMMSVFPTTGAFAAEDGVVRIGLIADSHITGDSSSVEKALDAFSEAIPDYDGLVMAGDVIMHHFNMVNFVNGQTQLSDMFNNTGYKNLKTLLAEKGIVELDKDGKISAKNKGLLYAAGNHEFPQNVDITKEGHSAVAQASKDMYVQEMGLPLCAEEVIGGYHFITAFPEDGNLGLSKDSEDFVIEKVTASVEENNDRPVFIVMHTAPLNTTYPSTTQAYSDRFVQFLESTPQVVMITGHMHTSQYDPRMVWQGGYTVASISCLSESASDKSEAAILEIKDNIVTIKYLDLKNDCQMDFERVFDIPNMTANPGDAAYWKYNNNRADKIEKPTFAENSEINVLSADETEVELEFPAVPKTLEEDGYMIASYRIKITDKELQSKAADISAYTDDYFLPAHMRKEKVVKTVTNLEKGTDYIAEISACNVWGVESDAIVCEFTTSGIKETTAKYNSPQEDDRNPEIKYIKSVKAGETEATANYTEFNGQGRGPFKDSRGPGEYFVVFYEAGMYITFEFEIEKSGMYEIMTQTDSISNETVRAIVDGIPKKPVTLIGKGAWYNMGTVYSSMGKVPLEAGKHTITIEAPEKLSNELHIWSVCLAMDKEASVTNMFCTEGTPWEGHYSDYSRDKKTMAYQLYGDGYGAIEFEFNAPVNGEYIISVDAAGGKADNSFSVFVDSEEKTTIKLPAGVASTIGTCTAENTIRLEKGTKKIKLLCGKTSAPYFRSISIVSYDLSDLWSVYPTSSEKVTSFSGGHSGDTNVADGLIMMAGGNGYITYRIIPARTGKYDISWQLYSTGFYAQTLINGEAINGATYFKQANGFTDTLNAVLMAGRTYDITLKAVTSGHAYVYAMKIDFIGEPDNGGEGIYYDIYAGDSIGDNYDAQSATGIKYGNGYTENGWGCYGGLYSDFKVNIDFAGWYDINLVLGSANSAIVNLSIDGMSFCEKTSNFVEGENWAVRRDNDFGQVFFMPGEHTFRITGVNGTFMIYKTRLSFNRADDGKAPLSFSYSSTSYTDKGGANVQTYNSPYPGVVLGEGNSYAEYTVYVPEGNYAFELCYGAKAWDGQMSIKVNGEMLGTYPLPMTGTSLHQPAYDVNRYYTPEILSLKEGRNTIRLQCEQFAPYQDENGYAYFSYSTFKLTRLMEPDVSMYEGKGTIPYTKASEIKDGTMTVKAFLPRSFKNESVIMYAAIYEGNRLYKVAYDKTQKASGTDVLEAEFTDILKDGKSNYTCRFFFWNESGNIIPICEEIDF